MSKPQPPRPFGINDRIRSKKTNADGTPVEEGVVIKLRDREDFDTLLAVDGHGLTGYWRRSAEFEIEDPDA